MYIIDPVAAERVKEYLSITTQAYPAAELVYSTTIIQQILNSLGTEDDFFVGIQDQLMGRCKAIRSIFKDGGDKFKIKSPCGNMYILVKWYVQVVVFFFFGIHHLSRSVVPFLILLLLLLQNIFPFVVAIDR